MLRIKQNKQPAQRKYSVWYNLDETLCGVVLLFGLLPMILFPPYQYIVGCSVPAAVFLVFGKKLYEKERQKSVLFRRVTGCIRAVLYTLAIGGALLAYTMLFQDTKWLYPVQRMVYLSHFSEDSTPEIILPRQLPQETADYTAYLLPKFVRGATLVSVSYVTDSGTLNAYCAYAEEQGAEHILAGDDEWTDTMEESGASEAYIFPRGGVWMLNRESGFFRIYWAY